MAAFGLADGMSRRLFMRLPTTATALQQTFTDRPATLKVSAFCKGQRALDVDA